MIILIQTPHPWRGIRQRPHHLAMRFTAAGHFVRWAEPRYLRWLAGRAGDFCRARDEDPAPNLQVRVRTLVNGERMPFIRAHNKFWLARTVGAPLPREAEGTRVLWLYNPHEAHLADRIPHDLLIYDIMDEYQGFPWSPPRIADEERDLLARADWVFAGTQALYEAKRPLAEGRIECILSGVETERFMQPAPDPAVEKQLGEIRSGYARVAGYAGMIDLRLDQDLLIQAARRLRDWAFVLVGPVATDVTRLTGSPNIFLPGQQPYESLPAWYHGWDAALLPFAENELTRHINPTKMLEYAAAGLPILARALPDVKTFYAEGAWLYEAPEDFIGDLAIIGRAPREAIKDKLEIARGWAAERSWDAIASKMMERLEEKDKGQRTKD